MLCRSELPFEGCQVKPIALSVVSMFFASFLFGQEKPKEFRYQYGPDSERQEGVPEGVVETHEWRSSNVYPGTVRRYYTYVPMQYDAEQPAALMVFLDGHAYLGGEFRVPVVFDNLIHKKQMPVTIGVFVDPGHKKEKLPPKPGWQPNPENRAVEYDTTDGTFAKFLHDEILAEVKKKYNISDDPELRAICGSSSGGIGAFTVAWERPDSFRKVLSHIGSFVNIRGGHAYPSRIRKEEKKPLRVLLQEGSNDLDNKYGNWPLANQQMNAALEFRKYDVRFVYGKGAHSGNHGAAILPSSMRWLWRGTPGVETNLAVVPDVQTAEWAVEWWMPRHEQKLAERKVMKDVDLLMIGDSITHSWENGGKDVWDKMYAHRKAFNIGFSGDRTENVLWRLDHGAVDDISPKLAVIMIGTNNAGHREESPHHTAEGVRAILDDLEVRLPESKILLLGIFPRGKDGKDTFRKLTVATNGLIKEFADEKRVFWLDIGSEFLNEDGTLPESIMPDFLHPNEKGYEIWANAMEPSIKKLLGE